MNPASKPFVPDPSLAEEWDHPAMAEFKRQEAEERVAFGKSHTQEEWFAALESSSRRGDFIQAVAKKPASFPFKPVHLTW